MGVKVKELADPRTAKAGCTRPCCNKDPKRVAHDKVWAFSRANPGVNPFK